MIYEKLMNIQNELKAPKSQFNNFGKYKYRNAEDILEAVKPLCFKEKVALILTDEIVVVGERYYVKATARIFDDKEKIEVSAFAREEESKKGMDGSQVTGASSSYARKYALNGLFDIDDTKDSDDTNTHGKDDPKDTPSRTEQHKAEQVAASPIDDNKLQSLQAELDRTGYSAMSICKGYKVNSLKELNVKQYADAMTKLKGVKDKPKQDLGLE